MTTATQEIAPPLPLNGFRNLATQIAHHWYSGHGPGKQLVVDLVTFPRSDDPDDSTRFLAETVEFRARKLASDGLAVPPFTPIDRCDVAAAGWPSLVDWHAVASRLIEDERARRIGS
jgi:hypothetical protein